MEPALLHSPHLPALHGESPDDVCSCGSCCKAGQLVAVVCCEACAGRRVQQAVFACSALFCGLCFACHPHCPSHRLPPFKVHLPPFSSLSPSWSFLLRLPLVHVHVRQDHRLGPAVCQGQQFVRASSLPAARLSRWQLQHGPAVAARAPVHLTC